MNEEHLGSIATFAQMLGEHLATLGESDPGLPDAPLLTRLVEVTFFAGLHEEEARRTELTIAWMGGARHCAAVLELRSPVLATPKNIAKLAPAAQLEDAALAIRSEGDDLVIWALLQHGATIERPLSINSIGAGLLRVDYRNTPRALYARGEMLFLDAHHEVRSPARRLTSAFSSWSGAAGTKPHIDARAATVTRIATRALVRGHGGMILLVPSGASPRGVRMHYEAGRGTDMLAARYAELMDGVAPGDQLERIAEQSPVHAQSNGASRARARYDEALDFVASLTATDNALLLDTDLNVRGFGVQVIEGEAPLETFEHANPYTASVHVDDISTFKGTRHPAGVIFCLRQEGEAAAIIASQDARLSLVVKDAQNKVEVLGSYERGFGWR